MNLDTEFLEKLASAEPAPGGGGASAYAGALAAALAAMVGNLAVGKPKYADEQEGIRASLDRLAQLRARLLELVPADADAYLPLNRAYRMPRATKDEAAARQEAIQQALGPACDIPLEIMEACSAIIDEADYLARHGSKLAVSDAGAAAVLARCAGEHGMVGGQCIDLATENRTVSLDELCEKDTGKTANLIMAACMMGCIAAGANETQINAAKEYALHIGLAFQIRDDILDVTGDAKELGKNIGVDAQNARCTYVSIMDVEKAQALVDEHTEKALHALDAFDADSTFLHEFAEKLATRSK